MTKIEIKPAGLRCSNLDDFVIISQLMWLLLLLPYVPDITNGTESWLHARKRSFFFSFFSFQFCEFFIIIILIKKIDWSCHRDVFWKKDTSRVLHVTFFNILSRVTTSSTCWHIVNSEKVQDRNLHTGALSKVLKFKKLCFFSTALSEKKQSCIETFISVSLDISQALGGNYHNMKWDVHIFEDSNT